jgi:hypothetical protein
VVDIRQDRSIVQAEQAGRLAGRQAGSGQWKIQRAPRQLPCQTGAAPVCHNSVIIASLLRNLTHHGRHAIAQPVVPRGSIV